MRGESCSSIPEAIPRRAGLRRCHLRITRSSFQAAWQPPLSVCTPAFRNVRLW